MTAFPGSGLQARLQSLTSGQPGSVTVPDPGLRTLDAGNVRFFTVAGPDRRVVGVRLYWRTGSAAEDARVAGLHAVTMQALIRSPAPGGVQPLAGRLESMGITVSAGASFCSAYLELRGPAEYIHPALRLAAAAVAAGALDQKAVSAARSIALHEIVQRQQDLAELAVDSFLASRARPASFLARRPEGTAESLRAMSFGDCRDLASRLPGADGTYVVIAGDQAVEGYVADLSTLAGPSRLASPPASAQSGPQASRLAGDGGPSALRASPPAELTRPAGERSRAYLLWGVAAETADVAAHVAMETAAHMLGGWSGSRLNRLLRERLGLTYGVNSSATSLSQGGRTYSLAHVGMAVPAPAVQRARDALLAEIAAFLRHTTPDEAAAAAVRLLRQEAHFHDSIRSLIARAGSFLQAGLPEDFARQRIDALRSIDLDRFRVLAGQPTLVVLADPTE